MNELLTYLQDNAVLIGIILPLIALLITLAGGVFKFGQYVNVQRKQQDQIAYTNYHHLVERLTAPLPGSSTTWLDVQKAAVFELRNYPQYKEVTRDILSGWIDRGTSMDGIMHNTLESLGVPYDKTRTQ